MSASASDRSANPTTGYPWVGAPLIGRQGAARRTAAGSRRTLPLLATLLSAALMTVALAPLPTPSPPLATARRAAPPSDATQALVLRTFGSTLGDDSVETSAVDSAEPATSADRVRVLVSGDVLLHNSVWEAARSERGFDFAPLLAGVRRPIRHADIAWCHLETPLAPPSGPFTSYPLFSVPPQIAAGLRGTGYDGCTTASNHAVDQGTSGIDRTLDALDEVGLIHAGTARTRAEARRLTVISRGEITVAWLSYTYGLNGLPLDPARPWQVNLIDPRRIIADARRARQEGADAVVLALHWGEEYQPAPTSVQRELAQRLTRSGLFTFIYGHHTHVVQPIERVNGTWVIFGLGNLLADQAGVAPGVDDGLLVEVTLRRRTDGTVVAGRPRPLHTRIVRDGGPHVILAG